MSIPVPKDVRGGLNKARLFAARILHLEKLFPQLGKLSLQQDRLLERLTRVELAVSSVSEQLAPLNMGFGQFFPVDTPIKTASKGLPVLPPILLNTMPKSGSIYIARTLASSLGVEYSLRSLANGFFPIYFMQPEALNAFCRGNIVRQEHFDCSEINLRLCEPFVQRLVLHVRDPREALLSWTHHVNRLLTRHPNVIAYTVHPIPRDFLDWPFDRQLDWHIDRFLVATISWLRQWLAIDQNRTPIKVLLTNYVDLIKDERRLFKRILDFYEIPEDCFQFQPPTKTIDFNFRKGDSDEWKTVFTKQQKARCLTILGNDLIDKFEWHTD